MFLILWIANLIGIIRRIMCLIRFSIYGQYFLFNLWILYFAIILILTSYWFLRQSYRNTSMYNSFSSRTFAVLSRRLFWLRISVSIASLGSIYCFWVWSITVKIILWNRYFELSLGQIILRSGVIYYSA